MADTRMTMMPFIATSALVTSLVLGTTGGAAADHTGSHAASDKTNNVFVVGGVRHAEAAADTSVSAASEVSGEDKPTAVWRLVGVACQHGGICTDVLRCPGGEAQQRYTLVDLSTGEYLAVQDICPGEPPPIGAPAAEPAVTPARVLEAFREVPLPASDIVIQPAGGETLVNHPTFYRTDASTFDETVTFFGGRVTVVLHITPTTFQWNHGDGTTATTTDPGSAYSKSMGLDYDHLVFHEYTQATRGVPVSVDTTWSATWTLNGRDMGAVPGTVSMDGNPQTLDIYEARPVLVS